MCLFPIECSQYMKAATAAFALLRMRSALEMTHLSQKCWHGKCERAAASVSGRGKFWWMSRAKSHGMPNVADFTGRIEDTRLRDLTCTADLLRYSASRSQGIALRSENSPNYSPVLAAVSQFSPELIIYLSLYISTENETLADPFDAIQHRYGSELDLCWIKAREWELKGKQIAFVHFPQHFELIPLLAESREHSQLSMEP